MTAAFEKANPNIKVNNTLVAYEALHDKIVAAAPAGTYDVVLGDVIWPAEFGSKGIVKDITDNVNTPADEPDLPGRAGDGQLPEQVLRDAVDPRHQVHVRQRLDAEEGRRVPGQSLRTWDGVVAALKTIKAKGLVKYPWLGQLVAGRGRVCDYAQLLGAFGGQFLDSSRQARVPDRRRPARRCSS